MKGYRVHTNIQQYQIACLTNGKDLSSMECREFIAYSLREIWNVYML